MSSGTLQPIPCLLINLYAFLAAFDWVVSTFGATPCSWAAVCCSREQSLAETSEKPRRRWFKESNAGVLAELPIDVFSEPNIQVRGRPHQKSFLQKLPQMAFSSCPACRQFHLASTGVSSAFCWMKIGNLPLVKNQPGHSWWISTFSYPACFFSAIPASLVM